MNQEHRARSGCLLASPLTTLTAGLVALALSGAVSFGAPAPQINPTPFRQEQAREQAPVGHRQPRAQDLPPGLQGERGGATAEQRALDKKLQICRQC